MILETAIRQKTRQMFNLFNKDAKEFKAMQVKGLELVSWGTLFAMVHDCNVYEFETTLLDKQTEYMMDELNYSQDNNEL